MAPPIVALLSDFGTRDHYAGVMKGVILGVCPEATLVDLTHEVPAHDVLAGALELGAAFRYFPAGTVFLAVVDPGVGSGRRALAVDAGGHRFVAPDNGLLTEVLREAPPRRLVELTARRYALPAVSRTFEGRDRFAPAAGWLARGLELAALGRTAGDWVRLDIPAPIVSAETVAGQVLRVDRFGNLITNIGRAEVERLAAAGAITIEAGPHRIERLAGTYAELPEREAGVLFGSTDRLEIALRGGRASDRLGLGVAAGVRVRRVPGPVC